MQESFNKWFFSKDRFKEPDDKEKEMVKPIIKKRKLQKYINRRVTRMCR